MEQDSTQGCCTQPNHPKPQHFPPKTKTLPLHGHKAESQQRSTQWRSRIGPCPTLQRHQENPWPCPELSPAYLYPVAQFQELREWIWELFIGIKRQARQVPGGVLG